MHITPGRQGGKLVAWYHGGHTVVIVGWSAATDSFLYIDTLESGSMMVYNGGIAGDRNSAPCRFLGLLRRGHDPARVITPGDRRFNIIRSVPETEGFFDSASGTYLEVVAGP
jgi:hypothetical protein